MTKFNLKEHIAKNHATFFSSINEGYDEFKRADKGSKDVTAKNKGEEEVYGAGVKKGEEIEKKKMKESKLRSKIKEMILAEMALDIDDMEDAPESEVDFLAELEGMLNEEDYDRDRDARAMGYRNAEEADEDNWGLPKDNEENPEVSLNEEEEEEEEEEEIEITDEDEDEDEGEGGISVTQNADADLTGNKKQVQDNLEAALEAAKALGDDKLATQIGNSLTFFTKQHVVKEGLNEEKGLKGDIVVYKDKNNKKIESKIVKVDVDENDPFSTYELENGDFVNVKDVIKINKVVKEEETLNESMFPMLKKILK
jgi:hypothetical protein